MSLALLAPLLVTGCDSSARSVTKPNGTADSVPAPPVVSDSVLEEWGYRSLESVRGEQLDWDRKTFGKADIRIQLVKAAEDLNDMDGWFCAFHLTEETYDTEREARKRSENLDLPPPGKGSKMDAELVLRDGFSVGKRVIILSTWATVFDDVCLPELLHKLQVHFGVSETAKSLK